MTNLSIAILISASIHSYFLWFLPSTSQKPIHNSGAQVAGSSPHVIQLRSAVQPAALTSQQPLQSAMPNRHSTSPGLNPNRPKPPAPSVAPTTSAGATDHATQISSDAQAKVAVQTKPPQPQQNEKALVSPTRSSTEPTAQRHPEPRNLKPEHQALAQTPKQASFPPAKPLAKTTETTEATQPEPLAKTTETTEATQPEPLAKTTKTTETTETTQPEPLAKTTKTTEATEATQPEARPLPQTETLSHQPPTQQGLSQRPKINHQPSFAHPPASPIYPRLAKKRGQQGRVLIEVWVDAQGQQTKREISSSSGVKSLDQAALKAVQQWRFKAMVVNGKAVASRSLIPIKFKLS